MRTNATGDTDARTSEGFYLKFSADEATPEDKVFLKQEHRGNRWLGAVEPEEGYWRTS